ncbi:sulfotransferase [Alteromonas aestuariivivens]|uniref:Sulfotransferase n=1 Tax=Alteromonas aestuariivivens TaxID=1938339 RepID=A0A3D8MC97_9ALTE|nr:sulfotransferase domain-containing protein [Alteromonas aestuariivivens]RDV28138.1 sulfotransferase [Alteromonas aestuariivivens]
MARLLWHVKRKLKEFLPFPYTVNFVIAGTQKGGTSALDAYLREHPQICMAAKKELHFFDRDAWFCHGRPNYARYHSWFSPKPGHMILGESTPIYMYWAPAAKRIQRYNPDMKLLIVLRNPIDRAYSHWNMECARKRESLPFWEAITREKERCAEAQPRQHRIYSYVDRGFYAQQIQHLWRYFPKQQVLVIKNEDLRESPNQTLSLVSDFLGITPQVTAQVKNVHSRPYQSNITDREREYLAHLYAPDIHLLEKSLGWDCSDWLKGVAKLRTATPGFSASPR